MTWRPFSLMSAPYLFFQSKASFPNQRISYALQWSRDKCPIRVRFYTFLHLWLHRPQPGGSTEVTVQTLNEVNKCGWRMFVLKWTAEWADLITAAQVINATLDFNSRKVMRNAPTSRHVSQGPLQVYWPQSVSSIDRHQENICNIQHLSESHSNSPIRIHSLEVRTYVR